MVASMKRLPDSVKQVHVRGVRITVEDPLCNPAEARAQNCTPGVATLFGLLLQCRGEEVGDVLSSHGGRLVEPVKLDVRAGVEHDAPALSSLASGEVRATRRSVVAALG
jgi:hypothetical protein